MPMPLNRLSQFQTADLKPANFVFPTSCRGYGLRLHKCGPDVGFWMKTGSTQYRNSCHFKQATASVDVHELVKKVRSDPVDAMINGQWQDHGAERAHLVGESILDALKWDKDGLVVAIAQHVNTGSILMQGFANRDAVSATIASGRATFYSRSRACLWTKGETSSNFFSVFDIFLDCDRDSIIYLGYPDGPTCHTGAETCYFTAVTDVHKTMKMTETRCASTTLYSLEDTIAQRRDEVLGKSLAESSKASWTQNLLQNRDLLCSKIREEADELCRTVENNEGKDCTASEMADVLYHCMVLLGLQDVKVEAVLEVLRTRFSQSGIEEKECRKR